MGKLSFPQDNKGGAKLPEPWVKHHGDVRRKINKAADVPQITTADATDLASAEALANDCKAKINALIAALNS